MLRTGCFVGLLLAGAIVLGIFSAVQFRKINTYVTAKCFISSIQFGSSFGSESRIYNRVVYNIIVYESDGSNTSTTMWSSMSAVTALIAINAAQYYQPNRTYACYHEPSPAKLVQVQFDRPSKTTAVGCLCGCIVLFLVAVGTGCLKCCYWTCRNKKVDPANHPPASVNSTEMTTTLTSPVQQNPFPYSTPTTVSALEEGQQRTVESLPPTYEEATGQTGFERLRRSAENAFNGLSFGRQTSSTTRV